VFDFIEKYFARFLDAFYSLNVVYQGGIAGTLIPIIVMPIMYLIASLGIFPIFCIAFTMFLIYCWVQLIINLFKGET
jgi:hypothetical protein